MQLLLASDEPVVRRGLRDIVRERGWEVGAEAADGAALLGALGQGRFDVAVIAVPLGDRNGLELVEEIRAAQRHVKLIVLSSFAVHHYAASFFRAGVSAFLRRTAEPEEIVAAIETVSQGRKVAPVARSARQPHERLSRRELEVFRLLAAGHSPTAIAAMFGVSIKTVSTYRTRILEKTGFNSNADIVGYAIRHRLV